MKNVHQVISIFLNLLAPGVVLGFAGVQEVALALHQHVNEAATVIPTNSADLASSLISTTSNANPGAMLLSAYKESLSAHPLTTKMMTGGLLATCGDAIAQSRNPEESYDRRRAASFMVFDMAYRALQHYSFPIIVAACHGQYALALLSGVGIGGSMAGGNVDMLAALEQTLASQLGIVPFLYYPVFFTLTAAMQGLDAKGGLERAKENFLPLMKRNLLFWIPVQFVQFGFIEESLQIPFLSVAGLCWTFILSVYAGSTQGYASNDDDEEELTVSINTDKALSEVAASYVLNEVAAMDEVQSKETVSFR